MNVMGTVQPTNGSFADFAVSRLKSATVNLQIVVVCLVQREILRGDVGLGAARA